MNKHIFGIFTYFITFFVSFAIVSFVTEKPTLKATDCFLTRNITRATDTNFEAEQQSRIKNFLYLDQRLGDRYFSGDTDTEKFIEQINSLDTSELPVPIQKTYKAHTEAWNNYARHLSNTKNHNDSDRECRVLNRRINQTYDRLLLAAKKYGVEFPR